MSYAPRSKNSARRSKRTKRNSGSAKPVSSFGANEDARSKGNKTNTSARPAAIAGIGERNPNVRFGKIGPMSTRDRQARMRWLWRVQGGRCCHCWGGVINPDDRQGRQSLHSDSQPSLEHIVPRSQGGTNRLENLLLAHQRCNDRRGTRPLGRAALDMLQIVKQALREMREREQRRRDAKSPGRGCDRGSEDLSGEDAG